ncbi:SGNH/GDSL hydrolase family protein [Halomonas salipaludis]|uniref:SGNH/GDSL hydrolase family protein n=1 Tax=Halomonas salipaludis TaxID=2032625 RepID=A0A2A2ENF2_9GAMM|nr:DUF4886 domain-containing protein [Halomonas salipaludis]PAU73905.1 hypothetical protein CK498_25360 [Halomonas salipaludis]
MLPRHAKHFSTVILLAIAAGTVSADTSPAITSPTSQNPAQILYVGNSYFYYNNSLHNYVRRMAVAAYPDMEDRLNSKSATISGAYLAQHDVTSYLFPGALGLSDPFDLVILGGHSTASLTPEKQEAFRVAVTAHDAAIKASGAQTVLYMTPAYNEYHSNFDPEMQDKVDELYTRVGNEVDALVIPAGLAFAKAYEQRPDIELHVDYDGSHPTPLGSYLAAATVFATLYDTPITGNPYTYYGLIDEEDAAFLQAVAEETVEEYFSR